eukprot:scaffold6110_cov118-Isochrysis_galbana.AAC.3
MAHDADLWIRTQEERVASELGLALRVPVGAHRVVQVRALDRVRRCRVLLCHDRPHVVLDRLVLLVEQVPREVELAHLVGVLAPAVDVRAQVL